MFNANAFLAAVCAAAVLVLPGTSAGSEAAKAIQVVPITEPDSEVPTRLDLMEVVIVGNTVFDEEKLYSIVEPFLGPGRDLDQVDRVREALEEAYRNEGYKTVSVRIPRQTARDGVVRLDVLEGRIARLNVVGSRYHSLERIRQAAPSMAPGTVPDFDEVQQDLVALNSTRDLRVTPALKAGAAPQTLDMDLAVDDSLPVHGSIELNNRHGQDTEPLRSQLSLSYGNLWQRAHTLSLTYQLAPQEPDESTVIIASYLARFATSPASVMLNYIKSNSNLSTVGGVTVLGSGEIWGLRLFLPVESDSSSLFPTVSLGVDYKNITNSTGLPDTGQGAQTFETPVTYYPFSVGVGVLARQLRSTTQVDLSLNFASSQLGSERSELDDNRLYARGQQFSVRGSFTHTQELLLSLQGAVRGAMQATDQPLITPEQFSAGGADSVRGYLEASALGDSGVIGSVELRSPMLARYLPYDAGDIFSDLRVFAFADAAEVRVREAQAEQTSEFSLMSWGYGFRWNIASAVEGVAQWAEPLIDIPGKEPEHRRLLFRLTGTF